MVNEELLRQSVIRAILRRDKTFPIDKIIIEFSDNHSKFHVKTTDEETLLRYTLLNLNNDDLTSE